jgi:Na+-driven multidrug efflux pump
MGVYIPLLIMGALYAGLTMYGNYVGNKGDRDRSERFRDYAFGTALVTAAYTAILLVIVAVDTPSRFTDAITIILVVCAFFAILLVLLFLISQVVGLVTRRAGR